MIIFIDDEPEYIAPFTEALRFTGFNVQVISNVDSAWATITEKKQDVDAVILDIMMPPGRLLEGQDTKEGLRTGLRFLEMMKDLDEQIPVICLTNADTRSLPAISHANHLVFEKKDIDPWQLVDKMSDVKRRKKI